MAYMNDIINFHENSIQISLVLGGLKGRSHQILDYILGSGKLKWYILQDRLWFLHFFHFIIPEILKNLYLFIGLKQF